MMSSWKQVKPKRGFRWPWNKDVCYELTMTNAVGEETSLMDRNLQLTKEVDRLRNRLRVFEDELGSKQEERIRIRPTNAGTTPASVCYFLQLWIHFDSEGWRWYSVGNFKTEAEALDYARKLLAGPKEYDVNGNELRDEVPS